MSLTSFHIDENEGSFQLNHTERDYKLKCLQPGSAATNKMDRLSSGQTTCNSVEKGNDGGLNFDNSISDAVRTKLRRMRDILEKEDPSSKVTDDDTLRRFLYARELNVEKASEMFAKYQKWRQTFVPLGYIPETMICDQLMKNSVHMQGFDKIGRPIAVIFLARHIPCRKTIENLKRHFVYIFDKMSASSSRGQTKFTIIADFDGWTYKNVDIRGAIAVLEILQDYYPERLGKVYLIRRPYIFWAAWKIVSPFIDQVTREKVVAAMPRVSIADRTRNMRRRGTRGAQLRTSASYEDGGGDVNAPNAPSNFVEKDTLVADHDIPPSTTVQGASSTNKIIAIGGWTKQDMLTAIDEIEFKGYSIHACAIKHGIVASNIIG